MGKAGIASLDFPSLDLAIKITPNASKCWQMHAVRFMAESRTQVFEIPPELAYGAAGFPPVIPPSATVTVEILLRDFGPATESQREIEMQRGSDESQQ